MKKARTIAALFAGIILLSALCIPIRAEGTAHNWYCVHVKDHAQPRVGADIAFAEELGGYYLDHTRTAADAGEKVIYLTFDAGYENGNVAAILDILKEKNATGAFFILGNLITHETDLVKRMAEEGHTVCNHTVRHRDMTQMGREAFCAELAEMERLYTEYTGKTLARYYRPPEGRFNRDNLIWARDAGYRTVFWSFAYPDWENERQPEPEKAKKMILENAHNGEVMLLHPTSATNRAILGEVIDALRNEGYRFGTLDELTGGGR